MQKGMMLLDCLPTSSSGKRLSASIRQGVLLCVEDVVAE